MTTLRGFALITIMGKTRNRSFSVIFKQLHESILRWERQITSRPLHTSAVNQMEIGE